MLRLTKFKPQIKSSGSKRTLMSLWMTDYEGAKMHEDSSISERLAKSGINPTHICAITQPDLNSINS